MNAVKRIIGALMTLLLCATMLPTTLAEEATTVTYAYDRFYAMHEADFMMHGANANNDGVYEVSKADKSMITLGSTRANLTVVFENVVLDHLEAITIHFGPERASRMEFWVDCAVDTSAFLTLGQTETFKQTDRQMPFAFDVDDYPYYKDGITDGTMLVSFDVPEGQNTQRITLTQTISTELSGVHHLYVRFPVNTWSGHYDGFTFHYSEDVSEQIEAAKALPGVFDAASSTGAYDMYKGLITDHQPVITEYVSESGFTHPGIGLTKEILDNMVTHVRAGDEPWATAFLNFSNLSKCTRENAPRVTGSLDTDAKHHTFRSAADIAYHQTLMYLVTGDPVYAQNARTTLLSFDEITAFTVDAKIQDSIAVYKLCMTADILANTSGSGWTVEDTQLLQKFISRSYVKMQYNHPDAFMNQYSMCADAYIASAIFRDDSADYAIGVQRLTTAPEAGGTLGEKGWQNDAINRSGCILSQIRAVELNAATGEKLDGSHIQVVEMGRDQGHAFGDMGGLGMGALMLLAQGTLVDPESGLITTAENGVNAFEFLDRRILAGANYICRYNLGYETTYIPVYVGALEIYHTFNHHTNLANGTSLDERKLEPTLGPIFYYYYYLADHPEGFDFATDESTRYLYEAYHHEGFTPEGDSTDWLGNGVLLFTFE